MKGSRPEQAVLSRDTDMSKTEDTRRVIETMVDGLNDHRIADIGQMVDLGAFADRRRLDLDEVPDMDIAAEFRAGQTPRNVDAFYEAFDVQDSDGMWLPEEERVAIW